MFVARSRCGLVLDSKAAYATETVERCCVVNEAGECSGLNRPSISCGGSEVTLANVNANSWKPQHHLGPGRDGDASSQRRLPSGAFGQA